MPSRKRAKGKARKAAKAKDCDGGNELSLLVGNLSLNSKSKCNHGRSCEITSDHICNHFVHQFNIAVKEVCELVFSQSNRKGIRGPFRIYTNAIDRVDNDLLKEICGNDDNVQILQSLLLSLGTNLLLSDHECSSHLATIMAIAVLFVQHKFDVEEVLSSDASAQALRDLNDGGLEVDTTRLLSKRIPCDCLKEKYAQAKADTKVGMCGYCREFKDRKELLLCGVRLFYLAYIYTYYIS